MPISRQLLPVDKSRKWGWWNRKQRRSAHATNWDEADRVFLDDYIAHLDCTADDPGRTLDCTQDILGLLPSHQALISDEGYTLSRHGVAGSSALGYVNPTITVTDASPDDYDADESSIQIHPRQVSTLRSESVQSHVSFATNLSLDTNATTERSARRVALDRRPSNLSRMCNVIAREDEEMSNLADVRCYENMNFSRERESYPIPKRSSSALSSSSVLVTPVEDYEAGSNGVRYRKSSSWNRTLKPAVSFHTLKRDSTICRHMTSSIPVKRRFQVEPLPSDDDEQDYVSDDDAVDDGSYDPSWLSQWFLKPQSDPLTALPRSSMKVNDPEKSRFVSSSSDAPLSLNGGLRRMRDSPEPSEIDMNKLRDSFFKVDPILTPAENGIGETDTRQRLFPVTYENVMTSPNRVEVEAEVYDRLPGLDNDAFVPNNEEELTPPTDPVLPTQLEPITDAFALEQVGNVFKELLGEYQNNSEHESDSGKEPALMMNGEIRPPAEIPQVHQHQVVADPMVEPPLPPIETLPEVDQVDQTTVMPDSSAIRLRHQQDMPEDPIVDLEQLARHLRENVDPTQRYAHDLIFQHSRVTDPAFEEKRREFFKPKDGTSHVKRCCWGRRCWSVANHSHPKSRRFFVDLEKLKAEAELAQLNQQQLMRLSWFNRMQLSFTKQWQHLLEDTKEFYHRSGIWISTLKQIEGNWGTTISTFFSFAKRLFMLNVIFAALVIGFMIIPQFLNWNNIDPKGFPNETVVCTYDYSVSTWYQPLLDFLQGTGFMADSVLFLGHYRDYEHHTYYVPVAYLLVIFGYFAFTLVIMVKITGEGIRFAILSEEQEHQNKFLNKILSAWDFCYVDKKAAELRHKIIYRELRNEISEVIRLQFESRRTNWQKLKLYFKRTLLEIASLVAIVISFVTIYFVTYASYKQSIQGTSGFLLLFYQYIPSLTITLLNVIMPFLFEILTLFEEFSPIMSIRLTLFKSVFLRLSSVVVLLITIYNKLADCNPHSNCEVEASTSYSSMFNTTTMSPNSTICQVNICGPDVACHCWETYVGQQFYKLALLDFFALFGVTFLYEYPRRWYVTNVKNRLTEWVGRQKFDIPTNVLTIVYSQTLCWLGAFYCPFLPIISVVKTIVLFYIKKLTLVKNCEPSEQPYKTSRSHALFTAILLIAFYLTVLALAYAVARIEPSKSCGPFSEYKAMYDAITQAIGKLPNSRQKIIWVFGWPPLILAVMFILSLAVFYFQVVVSANKRFVAYLRTSLINEGLDRKYLLQQIAALAMEEKMLNT